MAGLGDAGSQARQFWATRNGRQRTLLLGGAAGTVLLIVIFVRLIQTPDYKPLFTDLQPSDAQSLSAQLDGQGIPHQLSADGKTISVPADKLNAARMQTASVGEPHSGRMGFELFDKMLWGQTEFDEKVAYQRALEGELERSIETLASVESARVHLVMPADSVFLDQQHGAKASVVLRLKRGVLPREAVRAISNLVAGAVDDLKPEDVSIVDADTDEALGLTRNAMGAGAGLDVSLSDRLVSTLEPVVGVGKVRATVNVQYDQQTVDQNEEKYDPAVSALLTDQKSDQEIGGGAVPGGIPGTASNVAPAKQKPGSAVETQSSRSENAQYGVNKTVVHTLTPAGKIQRITAAILVDDEFVRTESKGKVVITRVKRSQDEMDRIQQLAQAVIGFDSKRGDSISVEDMSFGTEPVNADLSSPNWAVKVQKTVLDYSPALRPIALLGLFLAVYLFAVRPVQKHVLSTTLQPSPAEAALMAPRVEVVEARTPELTTSESAGATQLKQQAAELIRQKPGHTARALQAWLREEPS